MSALTFPAAAAGFSPVSLISLMPSHRIDLLEYGIFAHGALRNPSRALLYEDAVRYDQGVITSSGAIVARSHAKTGRSPKDKRLVEEPASVKDIWWGPVNIKLPPQSFRINVIDRHHVRSMIARLPGRRPERTASRH